VKRLFLLIILFLIIFSSVALAEKKAEFPELMRPDEVIVANDQLLIMEGIQIYLYSLKDFHLIKKIGKQGEGPQEFKNMNSPTVTSILVYTQPDHIMVNAIGKVAFLDKQGEFIREIKTLQPINRYTPMGKTYTGIFVVRREGGNGADVKISLCDEQFKELKPLHTIELASPGKKIDPMKQTLIGDIFHFYSYGDKAVIRDIEGVFYIFNSEGTQICTISPEYNRVKMTQEIIAELDKFFLSDIRFKRYYDADKTANNIEFPDQLPALKTYRVADGKIYAITSQKKDQRYETLVYDLTGQFLEKIFLPLVDSNPLEISPFTISQGKIYQLVENEDEEQWEFHINKI